MKMYNERNPPPDDPTEAPLQPDYDDSKIPHVYVDQPGDAASAAASVAPEPHSNPLFGLLSNPVLSSLIETNPLASLGASSVSGMNFFGSSVSMPGNVVTGAGPSVGMGMPMGHMPPMPMGMPPVGVPMGAAPPMYAHHQQQAPQHHYPEQRFDSGRRMGGGGGGGLCRLWDHGKGSCRFGANCQFIHD